MTLYEELCRLQYLAKRLKGEILYQIYHVYLGIYSPCLRALGTETKKDYIKHWGRIE